MAASAASIFMLNTMNVFAKLLSPNHSVIEVAFYRNAIAAAPFAVWIFMLGRRDLLKINSRPDAIVLRSVIGTVSLVATFRAFNFLPMADAQALFFTSSLFLPVMGWLFLKERVGAHRWSAVLIGFLGTLVIVRPTGDVNMTGVSFAVSAALMHASLGTLLRVLASVPYVSQSPMRACGEWGSRQLRDATPARLRMPLQAVAGTGRFGAKCP